LDFRNICRNITEKVFIQNCYIFPPHLTNAFALPCETENTEIVSFSHKLFLLICQ